MEQKSNGALISSVIIIILIIIGGIFLWKTSMKNKADNPQPAPYNSGVSGDTASDAEFAAMEEDLNGMDFDGLDEGM